MTSKPASSRRGGAQSQQGRLRGDSGPERGARPRDPNAAGCCHARAARKVRTQFRDGDPEAVRAVFRAYGPLVYSVALRVLGNRALAEDATQHTFVKAWRAARSLDANRDMGPWLATIARRVAIDIYRSEMHRSADPIESAPPGDPSLVSSPKSAEAMSDAWEVRRAITELPVEEEQVVRLQHFEGLTHREIAKRLKVPTGTVKSRSFRAHARLAGRLKHLRA